jgi:hypothetical protein
VRCGVKLGRVRKKKEKVTSSRAERIIERKVNDAPNTDNNCDPICVVLCCVVLCCVVLCCVV